MAYSIYHCKSQINECRREIGIYSAEVDNLKSIYSVLQATKPYISKTGKKYSSCRKYIRRTWDGTAASQLDSYISDGYLLATEAVTECENVISCVSRDIALFTSKIDYYHSQEKYWQRQLQLAIEESGNS